MKYTKGHYVVCIKSYFDMPGLAFTAGSIYRIGGKYYDDGDETDIAIELDDKGHENGWHESNFLLLGSKPIIPGLIKAIYGL